MIALFDNYKTLLQERLDRIRLLHLGEDSIRYDFFAALMQTYDLRPAQIQLEVALHGGTFVPINDIKSKRKEKPMIDLVLAEADLRIAALFRHHTGLSPGCRSLLREHLGSQA